MEVLWERGPSTANQIQEALTAQPPLAYSTVVTTLRILEDKGYLRHAKDGRAFIFEPLVGREEASGSALRYVVSQFFGNSPELLVQNLLGQEQITEQERDRLKKMIAESE
jgi:predicted transcriptional regulator